MEQQTWIAAAFAREISKNSSRGYHWRFRASGVTNGRKHGGREGRFSEDADKRAVRVVREARVIYWALYARFIGP